MWISVSSMGCFGTLRWIFTHFTKVVCSRHIFGRLLQLFNVMGVFTYMLRVREIIKLFCILRMKRWDGCCLQRKYDSEVQQGMQGVMDRGRGSLLRMGLQVFSDEDERDFGF